uniref:CSON015340 protein n=1 Tax=Culicoides sonorensis TaxID=179676 RepID=A0A336MGY5_CULSO
MALDRSVSPKRLSNSANFIHVMQFSGPNSKNFSYKIRHLSNSQCDISMIIVYGTFPNRSGSLHFLLRLFPLGIFDPITYNHSIFA